MAVRNANGLNGEQYPVVVTIKIPTTGQVRSALAAQVGVENLPGSISTDTATVQMLVEADGNVTVEDVGVE